MNKYDSGSNGTLYPRWVALTSFYHKCNVDLRTIEAILLRAQKLMPGWIGSIPICALGKRLLGLKEKWELSKDGNMLWHRGAGVVRRRVMKNLMKDYSKHSMRFDFDEIPESREARILTESLNTMNEQLKSSLYIAGQQMTLADVALATEVEQVRALIL